MRSFFATYTPVNLLAWLRNLSTAPVWTHSGALSKPQPPGTTVRWPLRPAASTLACTASIHLFPVYGTGKFWQSLEVMRSEERNGGRTVLCP